MTYDQLEMLEAIVKGGSFQAAANSLNKSQPSISVGIKKIEEEFNVQLFSRDEYRPKLTKEGLAFWKKSISTLNAFRQLETLGRELGSGVEPEIHMAIDAIFPLKSFRQYFLSFLQNVSTQLFIYQDILEGAIEKLESEKVQFAIFPQFKESYPHLDMIDLNPVEMIPVISSALLASPHCRLEDLYIIPQIVVRNSALTPSNLTMGVLPEGKKIYVDQQSLRYQMIFEGIGWGRLPREQVKEGIEQGHLYRLDSIAEVPCYKIPLKLAKLKTLPQGPIAKKLWSSMLSFSQT